MYARVTLIRDWQSEPRTERACRTKRKRSGVPANLLPTKRENTMCNHEMIDCPEHEGGYDCTPFCKVCEGEQGYCPICELIEGEK